MHVIDSSYAQFIIVCSTHYDMLACRHYTCHAVCMSCSVPVLQTEWRPMHACDSDTHFLQISCDAAGQLPLTGNALHSVYTFDTVGLAALMCLTGKSNGSSSTCAAIMDEQNR